MSDPSKELTKGDICVYCFPDDNGSISIVEVTKVFDSNTSQIKCLQAIIDNSGNDWFKYMQRTGTEMCATNEYLHKLYCSDLINSKNAEVEHLKKKVEARNKLISNQLLKIEQLKKRCNT